MICAQEKFAIAKLVKAWSSGSLKRNDEYQRGATWKANQMQGLIDSAFRKYPLPPVFLHEIAEEGLSGAVATRYEIVDGQQRIRAFHEFYKDGFPLLKPEDDKALRLPDSLRKISAPWGGRFYSQLDANQKATLNEFELNCYVIKEVDNLDEIRDLFIRLQSGTALNRQQIRDAWPGELGPFIESLAGKFNKQPASILFDLIDRRSDRGDDDVDRYAVDRQLCAQLFLLYQARASDRLAVPSITADELDRVYHRNTSFSPSGPTALAFIDALGKTAACITQANLISTQKGKPKNKHRKFDVIAVLFLIQDLCTNPNFKWTLSTFQLIGNQVLAAPAPTKGKTTSGRAIGEYYDLWRRELPEKLGVHLDPQRLFDSEQKSEMFTIAGGKCAVCQKEVNDGEAEYDHFPTPHYLGGKTVVGNGRLVHGKCNPRGYFPPA